MTTPSNPEQKDSKGIVQDGMSNEGSAEQANHAGGQSSNSSDKANKGK